MVIAQEPTQSLAALHGLLAADVSIPREQQDVVLPLMVPLSMVMLDEFVQGSSKGALTNDERFIVFERVVGLKIGTSDYGIKSTRARQYGFVATASRSRAVRLASAASRTVRGMFCFQKFCLLFVYYP
jgi:hypothetical protein